MRPRPALFSAPSSRRSPSVAALLALRLAPRWGGVARAASAPSSRPLLEIPPQRSAVPPVRAPRREVGERSCVFSSSPWSLRWSSLRSVEAVRFAPAPTRRSLHRRSRVAGGSRPEGLRRSCRGNERLPFFRQCQGGSFPGPPPPSAIPSPATASPGVGARPHP